MLGHTGQIQNPRWPQRKTWIFPHASHFLNIRMPIADPCTPPFDLLYLKVTALVVSDDLTRTLTHLGEWRKLPSIRGVPQ
jgi:hypothetical protein